mgnify:CR=1 FL=1
MPSFDIVSKTDLAEVDNAIQGVVREIGYLGAARHQVFHTIESPFANPIDGSRRHPGALVVAARDFILRTNAQPVG